jgi:hypothetical protein
MFLGLDRYRSMNALMRVSGETRCPPTTPGLHHQQFVTVTNKPVAHGLLMRRVECARYRPAGLGCRRSGKLRAVAGMAEDLPGGFIPQVLAFAAHLITPLEHLAAQTPGSRPTTFDPLCGEVLAVCQVKP